MLNKIYEKLKNILKEYYKSLLIVILIAFLCLFEFPCVIYTPGGIVPLEKRIEINNDSDIKGSFNMSYVSMRKGTLPMIMLSWIIPNWDLMDKKEVTIDDGSVDDLLKLEKLYLNSSIDNATILAYKKANKTINITKKVNNIIYIDDLAKTDLRLYDELLEVNGVEIEEIEDLRAVINKQKVGDKVTLVVNRNGEKKECIAEVFAGENDLKIGIAFLTTYEYETDPTIEIKTKSSESGSSGGLMISLAIYNALTEEDITKGKKIVGTGTISIDGTVGAIDGIKYKILGAAKNKADMFLCPEENYDEAIKVKNEFDLDINIIQVKTFDEALKVLN